MAKPANQQTHLSVVFTRNAWMNRNHVLGAPAQEEGESQMIIVYKGEEKKINRDVARDLIVQETALLAAEANNKERIAQIRAEVEEDARREKQALKKAA